jgi:hypothetical protein
MRTIFYRADVLNPQWELQIARHQMSPVAPLILVRSRIFPFCRILKHDKSVRLLHALMRPYKLRPGAWSTPSGAGLVMSRKTVLCLLIVLLMWGWVDDLMVSTANDDPSDDIFTSANDEYLFSARLLPSQKVLKECTAISELCARYSLDDLFLQATLEGLGEGNRLVLSDTDPLYAFMSLQC